MNNTIRRLLAISRARRKSFSAGVLLGLLAVTSSLWQLEAGLPPPVRAMTVEPGTLSLQAREQRIRLADGHWLRLAADGRQLRREGAAAAAGFTPLQLPAPRLNPSVTLLASGRVLIWGGTDGSGSLHRDGLWYDPAVHALTAARQLMLAPRAGHTATVLTDGSVLFVGGDTRTSDVPAERWDERENRAVALLDGSRIARRGHTATLQADGHVRIAGGFDQQGVPQTADLLFEQQHGLFTPAPPRGEEGAPGLAASLPEQGAADVLPAQRLALRFTQPLNMQELTPRSVVLMGPGGEVPVQVQPVEGGRLAFVTPQRTLFPASRYTVMVEGVHTSAGPRQSLVALDFTTTALDGTGAVARNPPDAAPSAAVRVVTGSAADRASCADVGSSRLLPCRAQGTLEDGVWYPGRDNIGNRWRIYGAEHPASAAAHPASASAEGHDTVLRGRVVRVDQKAVANVEVSVGNISARTTADGWFTLSGLPAGHQELYVDGSAANLGADQYGQFVVGVKIRPGQVNDLPYLMHLPKISARDKVRIPSPLQHDMVIGHPDIPGLELRIPKGTVIHDRKGRLVNELAIVPMPVNRAPFPVMENHPMAFTVEPGAAQVRGLDPNARNGIRIYYPNYEQHAAGTAADFWIYDPTDGWRVYGRGAVSEDGRHYVPEEGVALHETMGGMYSVPGNNTPSEPGLPPDNTGHCDCSGDAAVAGDPIDLKTGEFVHAEIDVNVDDVVPLAVGRHYRPNDLQTGAFGIGMAWNWAYTLNRPGAGYDVLELVQPNGSALRFDRISGSGAQGQWRQAGSNTRFAGALLKTVYVDDPTQPWGRAFLLALRDGARMQFSSWNDIGVRWVEDRHGNRTTLHYSAGLVTRITSPSGRTVSIAHDRNNRISTLADHTGRQWSYRYDNDGLLAQVTFPDGNSRHYSFDTRRNGGKVVFHRVESITDARGQRVLLNHFQRVNGVSTGRVIKQTLADGGEIQIDYAHMDGGVRGTLVTAPDGSRRRLVFAENALYPVSETLAYGSGQAQTFRYERNAHGQLTARTDPLGRRIEYQYNTDGQPTQVIARAPGSPTRALGMAYNANGDLTAITDPLNRTTRLGYHNRCLASVTDPLGRVARFTCNAAGQLSSATDPLQRTLYLHYAGHDLAAVTDPLGRRTHLRLDALGRVIAVEDAHGNVVQQQYDAMDRVTRVVDARGGVFEYTFDANGNLQAVLLPDGNGITYGYDSRNRLNRRTDANGKTEHWRYDLAGRLIAHTDRLQRTSRMAYDALGRPSRSTDADGTQVSYGFDAGNRLRTLADTAAQGTLEWAYDSFDAVVAETGAQGTVRYTYDVLGRRTQMQAAAQAAVNYHYDAADRLQRLDQGAETVQFGYDDADRPVLQRLPNGIEVARQFDTANQLIGLAWQKPGQPAIGTLGYAYDALGQLTAQTGSFASQALPPPSSAPSTFDAGNRQLSHNGRTLHYDDNGNLIHDGLRSYRWNLRDQLVEISEGDRLIASYRYDALGRRQSRTENGITTQYLYDGHDVVQETTGGRINAILTGPGVDQRFARDDSAGRTYFLTDHLGSTRGLTNASGELVQRYDYTPYGQTMATGPPANNPYQYTGRERDDNGLYFYRARYYSPDMGRFISEDAYGFASGDANFHAYALGNPIRYNDPSGHIAWFVLVPLIWGGIELGLTLYDAYDTGKTLLDPCATTGDKTLAASMFAAGMLLPGGGYGAGSKQVYQYSLRAEADGWYPVMTRGFKEPTSHVWLTKNDVWKFGTTHNWRTRYLRSYLKGVGDGGVRMVPEFHGRKAEALLLERMKIDNLQLQDGRLPAGNKIRR